MRARSPRWLVALAATVFSTALVSSALFAATRTYQVTGPVLEVGADKIVVQKGKDRWEIARDSSSKVPPDVKVGDKVLIEYRMTATSVEVKPAAAAKGKSKTQAP